MTFEAWLVVAAFFAVGLLPHAFAWLAERRAAQLDKERLAEWEDEAWGDVMAGRSVREWVRDDALQGMTRNEDRSLYLTGDGSGTALPPIDDDPFREFINNELEGL